MSVFYEKKKHKFLKISLILIFSAAFGMVLGYASVRYENFPFFNHSLSSPAPKSENIPVEIPDPEPIFTNITENNTIINDEESTESTSDNNKAEEKSGFVVMAEGSKVFLYKISPDGEKNIEQTLPINLNALRNEDKKLLTEGISVKNKQELASILEDFGS